MSTPTHSPFTAFLAEKYAMLRTAFPNEGRRRRKLRAAQEFWALSDERKQAYTQVASDPSSAPTLAVATADIDDDDDEGDAPLGVGILVRTDYSDDAAWQAFCAALTDEERDLLTAPTITVEAPENGDTQESDSEDEEADSEEEDEIDGTGADTPTNGAYASAGTPPSLFSIVSPPPSDPLRAQLTDISNLSVLRRFNDVDIERAAAPTPGTTRVRGQGSRLVGLDGFVEVYRGNLVWVYDAQSNRDRSVRLVSQRGEGPGAATGDSWRPRVSFLPELQVNIFSRRMRIDFGGLDRWDYAERQRNFAEADT